MNPDNPPRVPGRPLEEHAQADGLPIDERLDRVVAMRSRVTEGHLSGVLPRSLLTLPIWQGTHTRRPHYKRTWRRGPEPRDVLTVEVSNPIRADLPAGGLLRIADLDLLMALSHESLVRRKRMFSCRQADIFRWMGVSRRARPDRAQIQGSLMRMKEASIAHYIGEDQDRLSADAVETMHILGRGTLGKDGSAVTMEVALSDDWVAALVASQWQEIDLDIYANLARTGRSNGLARVIYCALTCARKKDLVTFSLPWASLNARYVPRSGSRLRYTGFTPKNPVARAIETLINQRAITLDVEAAQHQGMIKGEFIYDSAPKLIEQPFQSVLWDTDFLGRLHARQQERSADTTPSVAITTSDESTPQHVSSSAELPASMTELLPGLYPASYANALRAGWSEHQLYWLTVWVVWSQAHRVDGAHAAGPEQRWATRAKTTPDGEAWSQDGVLRRLNESKRVPQGLRPTTSDGIEDPLGGVYAYLAEWVENHASHQLPPRDRSAALMAALASAERQQADAQSAIQRLGEEAHQVRAVVTDLAKRPPVFTSAPGLRAVTTVPIIATISLRKLLQASANHDLPEQQARDTAERLTGIAEDILTSMGTALETYRSQLKTIQRNVDAYQAIVVDNTASDQA